MEAEQEKLAEGLSRSVGLAGASERLAFLNGNYDLEAVLDGRGIYRHRHRVSKGHGRASGHHLLLFYHAGNQAWVVSDKAGSAEAIAYTADTALRPDDINAPWFVSVPGSEGYKQSADLQVIAGLMGEGGVRCGWRCNSVHNARVRIQAA